MPEVGDGPDQLRRALLPEDRAKRLLHVELAGLAVQAGAAPVVEAVGGVGVLLDLEDQVARVDRVDLPAVDEDRVARGDRDPVHAVLRRPLGERLREGLAGDPALQADEERGPGRRVRDVPVLGLRLPAERRGDRGRGVHLEAQALRAVQPLDEEGEGPARGATSGP